MERQTTGSLGSADGELGQPAYPVEPERFAAGARLQRLPVIAPLLNSSLTGGWGRLRRLRPASYRRCGAAPAAQRPDSVTHRSGLEESQSVIDQGVACATGAIEPIRHSAQGRIESPAWASSARAAASLPDATCRAACRSKVGGRRGLLRGPARRARWLAESGQRRALSRVYAGVGNRWPPAVSQLRARRPGDLVGEPFRAYGGRDGGAGPCRVAIRGSRAGHLPGLLRLHRPGRMTVAPFLARVRPAAARRPSLDRTDGVRPVAGVALEWFMRLLRLETGRRPSGRRCRDNGRCKSGLVGPAVTFLSFCWLPPPSDLLSSCHLIRVFMQFTDEWLVPSIETLLPPTPSRLCARRRARPCRSGK